MASLPLDVLLEIAAVSDPVTLVRCAATCRAVRRRVADPTFWRRLRLRHADRFVPSLLQLVDTTAEGFLPPTDHGTTSRRHEHVASRDGLLLVRSCNDQPPYAPGLCVCDPVTRRSQALPAEPKFRNGAAPTSHWQPYVLLVGDGDGWKSGAAATDDAIGRPFQVLKTNLAVSPNRRFLQIHVFSSETGVWGPCIEIRTPHLHGSRLLHGGGKPLVVDGAVHWLCLTDKASYVLKLQLPREAKVAVTALPATYPRPAINPKDHLLATASPCGSLMVLVADSNKIYAWVQEKQTARWKQKTDVPLKKTHSSFDVRLLWFAQRSGIALIYMDMNFTHGFFWLDLRSMEIVRRYKTWSMDSAHNHPHEMHVSSWVPTFSGTF